MASQIDLIPHSATSTSASKAKLRADVRPRTPDKHPTNGDSEGGLVVLVGAV